jgi:MraZ protein
VVFTGTYEHAIDAKQRLAIPSKVRTQVQRELGLGEGDPMVWQVTLGEHGLRLYTAVEFERLGRELRANSFDEDYELSFFSDAEEVETDGNGRIRLPERLLEDAELAGEVVVLGNNDHLEIRDRHAWMEERKRRRAQRPELRKNPRRVIRDALKDQDRPRP